MRLPLSLTLATAAISVCLPLGYSEAMATHLSIDSLTFGSNDVRYGIQAPVGAVKGDILYLHGFGDRLDNHAPLFAAWAAAGFRVISFDFPSHGETTGPGINTFGGTDGPMRGLAQIARAVELETRENDTRPLIVAGWSTGGLLAVRIAQGLIDEGLGRKPAAVILFAPGVAVRPLVGEFGTVTQSTLTDNPEPPHRGPIKPDAPLGQPVLAADILINSLLSWKDAYPTDLPTLVFTAGDIEDRYVLSPQIRYWVQTKRDAGAQITGFQCIGAKHELDNNSTVGSSVIATAIRFSHTALYADDQEGLRSSCESF